MHGCFKRIGLAGLILAAPLALVSGDARAAPQALALVATKGTVALACEGRAELTTFFLQADRLSPAPGTRYHLVNTGEVRLIGTTRDGREIRLDPEEYLRFESVRTHVAMRVRTARDKMAGLDLEKVEITVGKDVALLPAPELDDPDPFTESEIAVLTGPLRVLASRIVDRNGERMEAARITNRMINLLAEQSGGGEPRGRALWRQAIGEGGLSSRTRDRARGAHTSSAGSWWTAPLPRACGGASRRNTTSSSIS
jgi:hypothetical protein